MRNKSRITVTQTQSLILSFRLTLRNDTILFEAQEIKGIIILAFHVSNGPESTEATGIYS